MTNKKVSGKARGARQDTAEAWLAANDPDYAEQKKGWTAPTTDVLSRINSEVNEEHRTLEDYEDMDNGNYRRHRHRNCRNQRLYRNGERVDGDVLEDDYAEDSRP